MVQNNNPLLLIAFDGEKPIGFKLGYVIPDTRTFFSWLGGVHPDYRKQGIAQQLLDLQEKTAMERGLETIYFTTYDRFPAMINLGKKNDYKLTGTEIDAEELKYWYKKQL